jgi:alkanesulfonate monooxygenase
VSTRSLHLHWFLPTYGDSRDLIAGGHGSTMRGDRPADLKYLTQLAQAAEINGFEAVLTPTGLWCEDAWLTTAMLIGSTETLKYLVAFRPGLISPSSPAARASSSGHSETSWTSRTATRDAASSSTSSANYGPPTHR